MANMLGTGAALMAAQLKAHASVSVTYSDGVNSVVMSATPGATVYDTVDRQGVLVQAQTRDYIVTTADLVLDSVAVLPNAGDTVTEVSGGTTYVYEVMRLQGAAEYRYVDHARTMTRIHTKLRSKT